MNNSFNIIFDKTSSLQVPLHHGIWTVKEKEPENTHTKELNLKISSEELHAYEERVNESNFSIKSTVVPDKKCDGFAFVLNEGACDRLLFVELKDGLCASTIVKALTQLFWSFVKMHSYLSICEKYDLNKIAVEFVIATQQFKSDDERTKLELFISNSQMVDERKTVAKFLNKLLRDGYSSVSIGTITEIIKKKYPFNELLVNKNVIIQHFKSTNFGESVINARLE